MGASVSHAEQERRQGAASSGGVVIGICWGVERIGRDDKRVTDKWDIGQHNTECEQQSTRACGAEACNSGNLVMRRRANTLHAPETLQQRSTFRRSDARNFQQLRRNGACSTLLPLKGDRKAVRLIPRLL